MKNLQNIHENNIIEQSLLTPIQQQAIVNLCQSKSIEQAAKLTGVTSRTIFNWLNDAVFLSELQIVQNNMWAQVNVRLAGLQGRVLDKLESLMDSPDEIISLKAADTLSNFLLKFYELSQVNAKLIELESVLSNE